MTFWHGGKDVKELAELGLRSEEVIDFSSNVSPFGTPASVMEALRSADVSQYPDASCGALREAIAKEHGVKPTNVLVGNGSTELIRLAALAFGRGGALITGPTFSEYAEACQALGYSCLEPRALENDSFALDVTEWRAQVRYFNPSVIFVCNPNNPTGYFITERDFTEMAKVARRAVIVMDEAFVTFAEPAWDSLHLMMEYGVAIRSMTKAYAMPGVRLGYAIGDQERLQRMAALQPTWSVSSIAQACGMSALSEKVYLRELIAAVKANRGYMTQQLRKMGLKVLNSQANFLLVKVGSAAAFRRALLKQRLLVRDCSSFGLPDYIRVAVRSMPECQRLLEAVEKIKGLNNMPTGAAN